MRILEKHVLKSYISAFLLCIVLLIVLGVIGDILGFLDDIFKNNIPLGSIISFYLHLAPFAFVNMVPFACLLSSVYVFNSLSKNHEITAVIASGLSLWTLLKPVLFATFALCLVTFIVNDKLVPVTMQKAGDIRQKELENGDGKENEQRRDVSVYAKGDQIIYAKTFTPKTNELNNVIIHRQDKDHSISEKINARVVKWENNEWVGSDVIVFGSDAKGEMESTPRIYKKKTLNIQESPSDFMNNQWDPKFMSYSQLKRYLKLFGSQTTLTTRRLLVDLYYKIAFPFTAMITVLVGVPFSVETGRSNALVGMARGILVAVTYLPFMAVSLALGKGGVLPPFLSAWLSNVLFAGLGIYYINRKS
ncbi:MAG: LptF/LptG family permease [Candidatus Omnitrophota bacterium]|nr:LptF/LptG family permease [Candidatus Omnitrophota bacterium]